MVRAAAILCACERSAPSSSQPSCSRRRVPPPRRGGPRRRCGRPVTWVLLHRRGAALAPLLSLDEDVDRACGGGPKEQTKGRVEVLHPGALRLVVEGTSRPWREDGYGPPEPVRRSAIYELQ